MDKQFGALLGLQGSVDLAVLTTTIENILGEYPQICQARPIGARAPLNTALPRFLDICIMQISSPDNVSVDIALDYPGASQTLWYCVTTERPPPAPRSIQPDHSAPASPPLR